jgi:prepilin peptidase dependent protein B
MKKQTGFTLIEILISLLIGLIVLGSTISMYANTIQGSTNINNSARLNYDLESVMQLMVNDISRAGYWGSAKVGANSEENPYTTGSANIQFPTSSCILYSYNSGENTEYYGFKLQNNAISIRTANAAEATADCTGNGWSSLTVGDDVNVTSLTFTANYKCLNVTTSLSYSSTCAAAAAAGNLSSGHKAVESRQIDIVLAGRLVDDTSVTKSLNGTVKVRNNRVFTQ